MLQSFTVGPLGVNAYVLVENGVCVLVDPGDEAERILKFLENNRLVPSLIVATHGHLDHTAEIPILLEYWEKKGCRPRLAVHQDDASYFGDSSEESNRSLFASIGGMAYFEQYFRPMPQPDLLLKDGDALPDFPYTVIHTPGHSPGSICLYNAETDTLVAGDTLFRDGIGRTDTADSSPEKMRKSLEKLLALPGTTKVFPGHGASTTIAREARYFQ